MKRKFMLEKGFEDNRKIKMKNVWRHSFAILLAISVFMSITDFSVFSGITAQAKENGSRIVYFGNYIQREVTDEDELEELCLCDNDDLFIDGKFYYQDVHYAKKDRIFYKDTPIAWRVLNDDGNYLTLLSDKILATHEYNGAFNAAGWKNSSIRKWLNTEFLESAFTEEEQEQIALTTLSSESLVYRKPSIVEITEDKIYLLNEEDMMNEEYGFSASDLADESRVAYATQYLDQKEQASNWWLRGEPNWNYGSPQNVRVSREGDFVRWYTTWSYGIRPVLRIKKDAAGLSETEPEEKKLNTEYQDSSFDLTRQVAKIFEGESSYGRFTIEGPEVKAAGLEFNLFKFNCEVGSPFKFDHTDFSVKYDDKTKTVKVLAGYNDKTKKELDKSSKDSDKWKNDWERTKALVLKSRQLDEMKASNEKDETKTLKEKYNKALKDAKEKKAKVMFDAEAKILGYFELQYDDSGQHIIGMNEGGVFIEGSIGVKARQYLFGTIVYAEEAVKGGVEITAGGKWDIEQKKIKPQGSFSLIVEPSIAVGANAVIADVQGGVKGKIKGTVEFPWKSAEKSVSAQLKGNAFVKLSTIIGVKANRSWKFPKYIELWPNFGIQDETELQMSYESAEPLGADQVQDLQANSKNQIDSSVIDSLAYEHAKPQTIGLQDGRTLLTYLSDSQTSADGQNTLMYRIHTSSGWSKAAPVFQTSRMDTMGRLFQYDGNVYVIYENSSIPLDESMLSEEVASAMEIYVAELDVSTGTFRTPVKISEANDTYKHGYLLCEKDNSLTAMWAENSDKDVMQQNGTTKIYESSLVDGSWTEAKEYKSIDQAIQHMGFAKGKLMYSIGNEFWLGGGSPYRGEDNMIDAQSFQYANDKIYYTGDRGLRYLSQEGGNGQGTGVYTSNTYVLDGERGVYWTQTEGFKSNIWYQSFEEGSIPVQITREDGYIGGFALYQDNGKNALVYTFQTVDENAQDPYGGTVLKFISELSRTEAKIDSVAYDVLSYQAGSANEFTVKVTNSGTEDLHNVLAVWLGDNGNEIERTLLCKEVVAGDSIDETVEVVTPIELRQGKLTVTLVADEMLESNAVYERSIEACAPDLSIEDISLTEVKVTNAGNQIASNVKICVYDGYKTGMLLGTYNLGDLKAGTYQIINISDAYRNAEMEEDTRQKSLFCVVSQETEEYTFSNNAVNLYADEGTIPDTKPSTKPNTKPSTKPNTKPVTKPSTKPNTNTKKPGTSSQPKQPDAGFVNGALEDTKLGHYQVIDAGRKTARLISVKNKKTSKLNIPSTVKIKGVTCTVTEIGSNVMKGNTKLTKVILGKNIVIVGQNAFYGCKKLKTVQVKGKVLKKIKSGALKKTSAKLKVIAKNLNKKQKAALLKKVKKAGNKTGTVK